VGLDGSCDVNGAEDCTACDVGYTLIGQVCSANTCTCTGGTAATAVDGTCEANNSEDCTACDPGYTLNGQVCDAHTCSCTGGIAAVAADGSCDVDDAEDCTECDARHRLNGQVCNVFFITYGAQSASSTLSGHCGGRNVVTNGIPQHGLWATREECKSACAANAECWAYEIDLKNPSTCSLRTENHGLISYFGCENSADCEQAWQCNFKAGRAPTGVVQAQQMAAETTTAHEGSKHEVATVIALVAIVVVALVVGVAMIGIKVMKMRISRRMTVPVDIEIEQA